jgi:hypothetical protein
VYICMSKVDGHIQYTCLTYVRIRLDTLEYAGKIQ